MSEGKRSDTESKFRTTLKEFERKKEEEAIDLVFTEGPKDFWGNIYDNWSETHPLVSKVFENRITLEEMKNYSGTKNPPKSPLDSFKEAVVNFDRLEAVQDKLVRLETTAEIFHFTTSLGPAVHLLNYINSQRQMYTGVDEYFHDVITGLNKCGEIMQVCYYLGDAAKINEDHDRELTLSDIPSFIYSDFAAVTLNNLDLVYHNMPPDDSERERLQEALTEEIDGMMQMWFDNGIDFLNITDKVPSGFKDNLMSLKHSRNVGSTLSIPTGVIGNDLEEMIDEDAFSDETEIRERTRFILLSNLRYLLETTHDTYIDEQYSEKYPEGKN